MYPCLGEVAFKPLRLVRDILDKGEQLSWGVGGEAEHTIATIKFNPLTRAREYDTIGGLDLERVCFLTH